MSQPTGPTQVSAKDPVCGMTVDSATAKFKYNFKSVTYAFCCNGCLQKFQADPERYLSRPASSSFLAQAPLTQISLAGAKPAAPPATQPPAPRPSTPQKDT